MTLKQRLAATVLSVMVMAIIAVWFVPYVLAYAVWGACKGAKELVVAAYFFVRLPWL